MAGAVHRSALARIQQISPRHLVIRTGRSSKGTGHHCVGRFFAFSQEPYHSNELTSAPTKHPYSFCAPILTIGSCLKVPGAVTIVMDTLLDFTLKHCAQLDAKDAAALLTPLSPGTQPTLDLNAALQLLKPRSVNTFPDLSFNDPTLLLLVNFLFITFTYFYYFRTPC